MSKIDYPVEVRGLIDELKRLPGIGPRSAERVAVYLLQSSKASPLGLAGSLQACHDEVRG